MYDVKMNDSSNEDLSHLTLFASWTFGSAGGTQEQINEVPGLRWFRINVPPGAFSGQTRINPYLSSKLENAPLYFTALSPLVEIRPKDLTTNEDISVLLPYEDENQDGIIDSTDIPETEIHPGYYSEENSCWGPLEPLVPDPTANVAAMYPRIKNSAPP